MEAGSPQKASYVSARSVSQPSAQLTMTGNFLPQARNGHGHVVGNFSKAPAQPNIEEKIRGTNLSLYRPPKLYVKLSCPLGAEYKGYARRQ